MPRCCHNLWYMRGVFWALLASLISLAFAVVVGQRYLKSSRPAFGAWAVGLFIFALAAGFQAVGESRGFTPTTFRGFYLFGGVLGVAYLALGTVFLLAPRRVALWTCWALVVVSAVSVFAAVTVSVNANSLNTPAGVLGNAIEKGSLLQLEAVILNIAGSLVLIGGSAWSCWRLMRDRAGVDRVICNVLLTIGAFIIAAGFSAAKLRGGTMETLGAYEAVGIAVMFAGFLSLGRVRVRASESLQTQEG